MSLLPKKKETEIWFQPMQSFQKNMNDVFDNFFKEFEENFLPRQSGAEKSDFLPRIDVAETDKEITVSAELPGLTEKDVEITMDHGILSIKGEKQQQSEEKQGHYHYVERKYGSFYRGIPIPADIEQNKIEAAFKNGVLRISLPKKEITGSQSRRIKVKGS